MPDILHRVVIKAPAERVFRAVTEQADLAAWWTPDCEAEPKVGTTPRFGFGPEYGSVYMRIDELLPGERVVWTCIKGDPEWVGTTVTFDLSTREDDGATILIFGHRGYERDDGILPLCSFAWAEYMISLRSLCETGVGDPYPMAE